MLARIAFFHHFYGLAHVGDCIHFKRQPKLTIAIDLSQEIRVSHIV